MIVDTSTWKPFRVGDLFTLERGKLSRVNNLCEGNTPYVGCSNANNGVIGFYDVDAAYLTQGPCIVFIGAGNGSAGYQIYKDGIFACSSGNVCGYCNAMSMESACFIVSVMDVMQNISHEWSFSNGRTLSKLREQIVLLPATPDGEPDWAYMETYMQQVLDREEMFAEHLASLTAEAVADGHVIDTSAWKAFHLYDVFDIDMGNKFDRGKMPIGDTVNFVGRTGLNNGVNAVCGYVDGVSPYASGLITLALGGTIGACFVQTEPFYTSQNVVVLIPPEHVGLYGRLFASSSIYASATSRYKAFSDELNRHVKSDFTFMLPATSDGAPDWMYMEQYMKDVMAVEALFADELDRVYRE